MATNGSSEVWVFNGTRGQFPSGLFEGLSQAEEWITRHKLTGVLTKYPLNAGAYDWALGQGLFKVKKPEHSTPEFIGRFTCAGFEHYHYEEGQRS